MVSSVTALMLSTGSRGGFTRPAFHEDRNASVGDTFPAAAQTQATKVTPHNITNVPESRPRRITYRRHRGIAIGDIDRRVLTTASVAVRHDWDAPTVSRARVIGTLRRAVCVDRRALSWCCFVA